MELPGMAADQLLIDESNVRDEHWEPPVRNLDRFFTSMYQYYVAKGLPAVILLQICGVVTLGFTISASIFLLAFVDWNNLRQCKDEKTCELSILIKLPFQDTSVVFAVVVVMYGLLFGAFWIWKLISAVHVVMSAITMERFYREKLGLRLSDLNEMQWHEVLQRLILLHEHGIHRVAIQDKLTEHDVVLRIMRKDNYMIGLINKKLLDLRVPWWISPIMSERLFLTKSLEWSLSFCILEYMFNEEFVISSSFLKNVPLLQTRLRVLGVVHMLLLPFMVIFMSIHFFFQNAQSFHSSKTYLGPRQWSPLALWSFREFNELPHIFSERINKSYEPSNEYIQSFSNPYAAIIATFVVYLGGAGVAIILLISIFSEGALLYVSIFEHNLLWHLGIFSAIYAGARSLIPDKTKIKEGSAELLAHVSAFTHYYPPHWMNRCHTTIVRDEMSELFPYKVHLFCMELLSVILTPIVLCFSLPPSAQSIIDFVRDHSKYVEGVGAVCDYSLFDFDLLGDDQFGAPVKGCLEESQRPDNGKMEKSFINFKQAHPRWRAGLGGGEALLENVQNYRATMEHQRDRNIATAIQDSLCFRSGGEGRDPSYQLSNQTEQKTNMRNLSPHSARELGLSDSIQSIINKTESSNEVSAKAVQQLDNKDAPSHTSSGPGTLSGINTGANNGTVAGTGLGPGVIPKNENVPFTGPNGVWGPTGYTRPENQNSNSNNNSNNIPKGMTDNNNGGRKLGPRNGQETFPPGDTAVSYYKSGSPSYTVYGKERKELGPNLGISHGLNELGESGSIPGFGAGFSATRTVERVNSRNDMPAILRSILKQENIDYQNDFYWMNRFQQERMRDPETFEKSMEQSTSLLRKHDTNNYSSNRSMLFDPEGSYFNSLSQSNIQNNMQSNIQNQGQGVFQSRNSRMNNTDLPYYNTMRSKPTDQPSSGNSCNIGERDRDRGRGGERERGAGRERGGGTGGDQSGFMFSLPQGMRGMGSSLGPGFESSILGGDMMIREGDEGEEGGEIERGERGGGEGYSRMGLAYDGDGAMGDMRNQNQPPPPNMYTSVPQRQHDQHQSQHSNHRQKQGKRYNSSNNM